VFFEITEKLLASLFISLNLLAFEEELSLYVAVCPEKWKFFRHEEL
tara:strand:+ start:925 stop:1062 length:138 start_codon:yes stop_codon:yes gene_type:complete